MTGRATPPTSVPGVLVVGRAGRAAPPWWFRGRPSPAPVDLVRTFLAVSVLLALACGATPEPLPTPSPEEEWIDQAVDEALEWEIMPGTTGEPDPARRPALAAFFRAHPEYRDPETRARLGLHACGLGGTEAAHAWLTAPPPKTAVRVEVTGDDWRVLVAHTDVYCTSDDWTWYTNEADEGARARGASTAYAAPDQGEVLVLVEGKERARVPLQGQGFLALRAGQAPVDIAYDPSAITPGLDAAFGPPSTE